MTIPPDRGEQDDRLTSKDAVELNRRRKENAELQRTMRLCAWRTRFRWCCDLRTDPGFVLRDTKWPRGGPACAESEREAPRRAHLSVGEAPLLGRLEGVERGRTATGSTYWDVPLAGGEIGRATSGTTRRRSVPVSAVPLHPRRLTSAVDGPATALTCSCCKISSFEQAGADTTSAADQVGAVGLRDCDGGRLLGGMPGAV